MLCARPDGMMKDLDGQRPGRFQMALTLQKKLELAGALSKVQPQLQRLHIVEKPKQRHVLRNVILIGSTIAVGAVVAVAVCRRRACCGGAVAGNAGDAKASSPEQGTPEAEPHWDGPAIDADGSDDIGAQRPE
jgi:hypothetical protein